MSEHQWPTFKAGDRVWCALTGQWATLQGNPGSKAFIVDGWAYDELGRIHGRDGFPLLFHNKINPEDWPQPPAPLPDLPVDAPIMVKDFSGWCKRHFARWENGKAACWANGLTSFTSQVWATSSWKEWRLPTDEELTCPNE